MEHRELPRRQYAQNADAQIVIANDPVEMGHDSAEVVTKTLDDAVVEDNIGVDHLEGGGDSRNSCLLNGCHRTGQNRDRSGVVLK